jgi:16S rRNA processing protein RimM
VLTQSLYTVIAQIVRPQGRRGEVLADLLTDFPEKFSERKQLWLSAENSTAVAEFGLEDFWFHKGRVVLKFLGVDSISEAERLAGMLVQISRETRSNLDPGSFYVGDLIGSQVRDISQNRILGTIEDVDQNAGAAPMLLVRQREKEYDIPFAEEFIVKFDTQAKLLELKLPEGLLDVNAPLSDEEKKQQRENS